MVMGPSEHRLGYLLRHTSYLAMTVVSLMAFHVSVSVVGAGRAVPLRVDINANTRSDMKTPGWDNWFPGSGPMIYRSGSVTIRFESESGETSLWGDKKFVVDGVTVGCDGIVAGDLKVTITGLPAGEHAFTGYHQIPNDRGDVYHVEASGNRVQTSILNHRPLHNDDLNFSFIRFDVNDGVPAEIRIHSIQKKEVFLNGFVVNGENPAMRAKMPVPSDLDRHVDGDAGRVLLSWTPAKGAIRHRVYFMAVNNPSETAHSAMYSEDLPQEYFHGEFAGNATSVPVGKDTGTHYFWRVDTVRRDGEVTPGEVWRFRVRHLAFPGAEGYGRYSIGGRGGKVFHVTSLADSGPGTLREAVESTGPRTVVFDVSGLISLKSKLLIRPENAFLTIAGQTAPGKGICIRNYTFGGLGAEDSIIRFIRLRLGNLAGETMDGMGLASSHHCIIDHCSISWTLDEAFSSRGAGNITFQRNIISEALNIAGHRKYKDGTQHGFAGSIGGNTGSFHHNLLAHNAGRNWSLAGGVNQANVHHGKIDIRNMVVYNWHHRTTDGGAQKVQFVNNYFKPGPASKLKSYLNPQFEHPEFGPQQYFVSGNIMEGVNPPEGPEPPFTGMVPRGSQTAPVTVSEPFFESYVTTHTANEAFQNVLNDVGCSLPVQDDHDRRIIHETRTGTTSTRGSRSGLPGLPDTQDDSGGWEDYPEIHRPEDWDTDGDGIPNFWELKYQSDPDDPADGASDPNRDGFTLLEDYLHWLTQRNRL